MPGCPTSPSTDMAVPGDEGCIVSMRDLDELS